LTEKINWLKIADMEHLTASHLIDLLGGTNRVARLADVGPTAVSMWRQQGIPESRMVLLARRLEAEHGIPRTQLLRREIVEAVWPELANCSAV
jgi:hypothetical protein